MMVWQYLYWLMVLFAGVAFPVYGLKAGPGIRQLLLKHPDRLAEVYRSTVVFLVFIAVCVVVVMAAAGDPFYLVMLRLPDPTWFTAALFLLFFILLTALVTLNYSDSFLRRMRESYSEVLYILPSNREEYQWSIAASFAAGICEEIVYRGFLYWQLSLLMPVVPAILLANLAFGVAHYGTGLKNAGGAFLLGLVFSALSIPFNSLLPAILAHILVDMYAATLIYRSYR